VIEFVTLSTALHPPRLAWWDREKHRAGFVDGAMPDYVRHAYAKREAARA
jgi:hypothetical protein